MNKISNPHIVSAFANELNDLNDDILRMGGIAEHMVRDATTAAIKGDEEFAARIVWRDLELDELEQELGQKIVRMLALRQPLAADLRSVLAALKTAHNLERVGDLAKNIARRTKAHSHTLPQSLSNGVQRMGEQVSIRLHMILDAYAMGDCDQAISVWERDDEIDMFHNSLFREILMVMHEDQEHIDLGTNLMFIIKNFERIGDHCTNIAEEIHFRETGEFLMREPKLDV